MKTTIIFILSVFMFLQCGTSNNNNTINEEKCNKLWYKLQEMKMNYLVSDSTIWLDSTLYIIDTMLCDCNKYYAASVSRKLQVLSIKKDYIGAFNFIQSLEDKEIYPFYNKFILLKRFEAIQAQSHGDTITKNKLILEIINYIKNELVNDSEKINQIFQLSDDMDAGRHIEFHYLMNYYYYRMQIENIDKIQIELDSLQKEINGNQESFEWLKDVINVKNFWLDANELSVEENFMFFNGI